MELAGVARAVTERWPGKVPSIQFRLRLNAVRGLDTLPISNRIAADGLMGASRRPLITFIPVVVRYGIDEPAALAIPLGKIVVADKVVAKDDCVSRIDRIGEYDPGREAKSRDGENHH